MAKADYDDDSIGPMPESETPRPGPAIKIGHMVCRKGLDELLGRVAALVDGLAAIHLDGLPTRSILVPISDIEPAPFYGKTKEPEYTPFSKVWYEQKLSAHCGCRVAVEDDAHEPGKVSVVCEIAEAVPLAHEWMFENAPSYFFRQVILGASATPKYEIRSIAAPVEIGGETPQLSTPPLTFEWLVDTFGVKEATDGAIGVRAAHPPKWAAPCMSNKWKTDELYLQCLAALRESMIMASPRERSRLLCFSPEERPESLKAYVAKLEEALRW